MKYFIGYILIALIATVFSLSAEEAFEFHLPNYSYHKFDNGFELILVENHTNPLIASVVVVRTGLRNETPENNGVSHMLEHMTFNGTEKRTQKELYDELDFYGIYLNAQTSEDYTTYMALNHRDQVEISTDILADMLFHCTFPPQKFEKEKGIIAEEIRKDSENPHFKEEQAVRQAFYREPPYSMPVIGTVKTVQEMTRQQVMDYYHTYYSPNNMIAIVVGDFDQSEMLSLFKKYFGGIPSRKIPSRSIQLKQSFPFFHSLENDRERITYVKLPAPVFASDNFIPFRAFYEYALGEENSPIADSLKSDESLKIRRVSPSFEFHPEFGVLTLKIYSEKDVDPARITRAAERQFQTLSKRKIAPQDLDIILRKYAISEILQMEKILYYGFLKAQELAVGGIDAFEKKVPALMELSTARVNRFVSAYPESWKNPEPLFHPGNWAQKIALDKYTPPREKVKKEASRIYRKKLANGMTVILLRNSDNPVLAMHFLFKNRSAWEPAGKTGIADFLHHALFKATKFTTEKELQNRINKIGAEIKAYDWDFIPYDDYYNVPRFSYIRMVTLDQFFDQALNIAAESILHPDLKAVFPAVKKEMTALAARSEKNARKAAKLGFFKMLFGEDHPLAQPVSGTTSSISGIELADLQAIHREYFSGGNVILSIVSGLDSATVFGRVEKYFADIPPTNRIVDIPSIPLTREKQADSTHIGSRQAYIYLGYTFDADPQEATALHLMNRMVSNQIAFSLREQKGWAYRLGSTISSWKGRYYFYVMMGTGRKTTHPAIHGIVDEVEKFKSANIDDHLLQQTRNSILAALVRRRASRESQAFTLGLNEYYGHNPNYFFTIYEKIKQVTPEEIVRLRDKYLQTRIYKLFYTIPSEAGKGGSGMPQMPPGMRH